MTVPGKIILHIGLPKTGTSTIQHVLYGNRDLLREQDHALYPSLAPNLSTALCTMFADDPRSPIDNQIAGLSMDEAVRLRGEFHTAMDHEISEQPWETLILSAEGVANLRHEELAQLKRWGERFASRWMVLVCVRHPLSFTRSQIQQNLKAGATLSDQFIKPPIPNFERKIGPALTLFGAANLKLFDFDDARNAAGGIVARFAQLAELCERSIEALSRQGGSVNESLSFEAVMLLDVLNRQRPMFLDGERAPRRSGREIQYLKRVRGRRFELPPEVRASICKASRSSVAWLNDTFGFDLYGDVFRDQPGAVAEDSERTAFDQEAIEDLAEIVGELATAVHFRASLDSGRAALNRGDLDDAGRQLRVAARLNPQAATPQRLLERIAKKRARGGVG